jgi:toxin ParE1/3/4
MKKVSIRPEADRDIDEAISYYASQHRELAEELLRDVTYANDTISRFPRLGSLRLAHELHIEGLRVYGLRKFPYVLAYIERETHTDVVRVLHSHQDIQPLLFGISRHDA